MRLAFHRRSRDGGTAGQGAAAEGGSLLRLLLGLALLAWATRSLVVAPFNIPSGSMLPTLYIGDYLMVAKWPYGYARVSFPLEFPDLDGRVFGRLPHRGDVVVFRHPVDETDLVKRVIGLPGDMVEVRGGVLLLNKRALPRERLPPFAMRLSANSACRVVPPALPRLGQAADGAAACLYPAFRETLPDGPSYTVLDQIDTARADDFGPVRVPAGQLFLMGDNRDDSLDSRYATAEGGIGFVPVEKLIGRALVTFWSTDGSVAYVKPWTWFTALRAGRIGNGYTGDPE